MDIVKLADGQTYTMEDDVDETRIIGIAIESVDGAIIDGLFLDNVTVESYMPDAREDFVFEDVTFR